MMRYALVFTFCVLLVSPACRGERSPAPSTEPGQMLTDVPQDDRHAGEANAIASTLIDKHAVGHAPPDVDQGPSIDWSLDPDAAMGPPYERCPVAADQEHDVDRVLEHASESYGAGQFAAAYDCASMAADLSPRSIDAHYSRALSASALGHVETARMAFTLALALDPDDVQTLAAAADFYINMMPRQSREPILIGLEQARRGRRRAATRRSVDKNLSARLILLEAQALNDLGQSEEALARAEEALAMKSDWLEAEHERGVALFNLCRFDRANDAFANVVASAPDDAYAHYHLGLINERLGRSVRSEDHFRQARALAPNDFWLPVAVSPQEFQAEVDEAISELPSDLESMLAHVSIEITDLPRLDDLMAVDPPFSPTILGLFRGLPLTAELAESATLASGLPVPDRAIVLYRNNLARIARSRAELDTQIRRTLLHELGHLSGLEEDELRRRGLE